MIKPDGDDLPEELLAGFVDGELSSAERARVIAWLAEHPEVREQLEAQEQLSPNNDELWRSVQPPMPTSIQWAEIRSGIGEPVRPSLIQRWGGNVAMLATATMLALLVAGTKKTPCGGLVPPGISMPCIADDPQDEEPYLFARADEVHYLALPESAAPLLISGKHPLDGSSIVIARADEVEFHGIGSDVHGRFPSMPAAVDPAMIWAP